uniref:Uncharacterized protein n=1 Tax=Tetraselmis sp. GSL018 TaxID=582737 RepID=A0A061S1D8_9CHLO|eukprot:CAMPEP_0177609570 /NCGR_PEP_ID=MMETSP0419_2-20121207/19174_1 /TAXON_ID=582737 /ORGANISM="Tetraselmis sp., Strain GSL018" /LENGTH=138 /DNA_ID=CAMNT_0019104533 /DNA_START=104 /DNA_END=520 /DNA_ORIENTATION=-
MLALQSSRPIVTPASRPSSLLSARSLQQTVRPSFPSYRRRHTPNSAVDVLGPLAALDIDWSDPDTQIGALGGVLGIALGIGIPVFLVIRENQDEERLEELRELNRRTYKETGEYLTPEEIEAIRPPRWTDRREFVDDD